MAKLTTYFLTVWIALALSSAEDYETSLMSPLSSTANIGGCNPRKSQLGEDLGLINTSANAFPDEQSPTEAETKASTKANNAPPIAKRQSSWSRIVSLHDVTSEIIVALKQTNRLVGIHDAVSMKAKAREQLAQIPRVENLESILDVGPDIVIGSRVVATRSPDLVRQLQQRGITVYLPEFSSLRDLMKVISTIAKHTDAEHHGDILLQQFSPFIDNSSSHHQTSDSQQTRPRIFVYDCCDPPFSAGSNTMLNELIERAGAINVFGQLPAEWTHVGWESVLATKPELIIINDYAMEGQLDVAGKVDQLRRFPSLFRLPRMVLPLHQVLGGLGSIDALHSLQRFIDENRPSS